MIWSSRLPTWFCSPASIWTSSINPGAVLFSEETTHCMLDLSVKYSLLCLDFQRNIHGSRNQIARCISRPRILKEEGQVSLTPPLSASKLSCEIQNSGCAFIHFQVNELFLGQCIASEAEERLSGPLKPTINDLFSACVRCGYTPIQHFKTSIAS
jgi:hypothetical protein